jgi:hypothetical protein
MNDERYFQLVRYNDQADDNHRFWLWMFSPQIMWEAKATGMTSQSIWRVLHRMWEANRQIDVLGWHEELWNVYETGAEDGGEHVEVDAYCRANHDDDDEEVDIYHTQVNHAQIGITCECVKKERCQLHLETQREIINRELARGLFTECLNRDLAGLIAKMM